MVKKEKDILLVDDEQGIRKVLGIALEDMGYAVRTAKNGNEALTLFRKAKSPIVLTDIKMPGMDGIELLKMIKKKAPETEIIMITGHGDMDLAIKSLKYQASDFITKPISDDSLKIALERAHERIDTKRLLREYTEDLERLVNKKTEQLINAERLAAVGQTVAGLSHAIKNIASGLKGGTFILEEGLASEDMKVLNQGWEMVQGNVEKITKLSVDLLNYAKTGEIHYQMCSPNQVLEDVYDLMIPMGDEFGVTLKLELVEDIEPFYFDPEGIYRCLLNLVKNAIDACQSDTNKKKRKKKNKEKKVVLGIKKTNNSGVEYYVKDNGMGMNEETSNRIFKQFYTTKGKNGNGLGLMMTKNIIEKHNGKIEFKSQLGKGSIFILKLPIKKELE